MMIMRFILILSCRYPAIILRLIVQNTTIILFTLEILMVHQVCLIVIFFITVDHIIIVWLMLVVV